MSKEVFMQTRVEPELRASFYEAAAQEHRPASQVLRQLMRDYVERSRQPDPAEQIFRLDSVRFAAASVFLEGLNASEEALTRARLYVEGKIELDELVMPPNG